MLLSCRDNPERLDQGIIECGIDLDDADLRGDQGMADECGLGISVLNVNHGLAYRIGAHDLGFQPGPEPGALDRLPGGHTVRRVLGIGNGDPFDLRPAQIRQTADLIADCAVQAATPQRVRGSWSRTRSAISLFYRIF